MEISYFKSAWNDIKHTPGWLGELVRLALLNLIPIFGQIVTMGYLYGWARDIAWGVHGPLPNRIFSNEDGQLYRRGFFALVVAFVISILPEAVSLIGDALVGGGMGMTSMHVHHSGAGLAAIGLVLQVASFVLFLVAYVFTPVGIVRMSIYNRLSAGLQLGRIWKMLRHDPHGALRIVGMAILAGLVGAAVVGGIGAVVFSMCTVSMLAASGAGAAAGMSTGATAFLYGVGGIEVLLLLAVLFMGLVVAVWIDMLTIRAVGYWMYQFDVPHWGSQDDPMPFEQGEGR